LREQGYAEYYDQELKLSAMVRDRHSERIRPADFEPDLLTDSHVYSDSADFIGVSSIA
jgi:hypothetical protein